MTLAKEQFDRLDFLHAWLEGQEYKKAHEDLRNYYGQAATAFGLAFKFDLDHLAPEVDAFPDTALNDTFRQTVQARQASVSPFSYYILSPLSIK